MKIFALYKNSLKFAFPLTHTPKPICLYAGIAQLVEHDLAKVGVAGSSPVSRSKEKNPDGGIFFSCEALTTPCTHPYTNSYLPARMVELVDTLDLKSSRQQCLCGFKSHSGYNETE